MICCGPMMSPRARPPNVTERKGAVSAKIEIPIAGCFAKVRAVWSAPPSIAWKPPISSMKYSPSSFFDKSGSFRM